MDYLLKGADQMEKGTVKVFAVSGRRILLAHTNESEYFAIDDLCTHDGAELGDGELYGYEVECPRHGACFDVRSGKALTLPATEDVQSYPVTVNADGVSLEINE